MTLSIIIPCYNEAATIRQVIEKTRNASLGDIEIIVVDDGSCDDTTKILKQEIAPDGIRVFYHTDNQGKGAAVRTGLQAATGDYVVIQDADLECNPEDLAGFLNLLRTSPVDVVFGSRFIGAAPHQPAYRSFSFGNRLATRLSNLLSGLRLSDMTCCYKMFRREIIRNMVIEENGFGFDAEITAKISRMNCPIGEVGVSYQGRTYAQGKKFSIKDGIHVFYVILKYNLRYLFSVGNR